LAIFRPKLSQKVI